MKFLYYLSVFVAEVDAQRAHCANNGNQRLDGVTVNDRLELFVVFTCESTLMNDSVIVIIVIIILSIIINSSSSSNNSNVLILFGSKQQ